MASGNTTQPIGPRLTTRTASLSARSRRSAAKVSVLPPAMWISSSEPTIRSISGTIDCKCSLTVSLATNRSSPRPWPVKAHSTGR